MDMENTPHNLYLNLLKKTLTFTMWNEPPLPVTIFNYKRTFLKRAIFSAISRMLAKFDFQLCKIRHCSEDRRQQGLVRSPYADTMIGLKRLDNIQQCIEQILEEEIEGDFIETGVWRGGGCIMMQGVLAAHGVVGRRVFVADSYKGLPESDPAKYPADAGDTHHQEEFLVVSKDEVARNFKKYGLLDDQVVFIEGWFEESLPKAAIEKLALLRLDGDMYSSTIQVLNCLYPKLVPGGYCIIDDYALKGCKKAVDDYRAQHGITEPMMQIDWTGWYWKKER
jgi:hypothetical protein